jgi:hypothetical protein
MTARLIDLRARRRARRYDAPPKDNVLGATDALLAERLRDLRLPSPPSSFLERNRRSYGEWLSDRTSRNSWRD